MIAAAGAGVAAIQGEFLGAQVLLERGLVQELGVLNKFVPVVRRVDVHLNHAGIGRHLQQLQARVARRWIAFEHDFHVERFGGCLDRGQQVEIVFKPGDRWHEDVQVPLPRLHAQRGAREPVGRLEAGGEEG